MSLPFAIPYHELEEHFTTASGPGGQNVNKVATAVRLSWNIAASESVPEEYKAKLLARLGKRLDGGATLAIHCQSFRTQGANRAAALRRLHETVAAALRDPKPRRPTAPTRSSIRRRLEAKGLHSQKKQLRRKDFEE